ncbi:MAG: cobyrinate a,c-diamide synthase [Magnetococcales bacterium]|nr:cobyrinate a,c-diamide synthase [Magnetococcales bacterium]
MTSNPRLTPAGFIVAGLQSRSGKTTLTLALMSALKQKGIEVAPFKAGPDYLDPFWHQAVCQRPSYSLDTFMVGKGHCRDLFYRKRGTALGIVEGVMGLYDGKSGVGGAGSTADLARTLELPVILVVNARGMAGSIVPLVAGFVQAAQGFTIGGIIANQVGSDRHAQLLRTLLDDNQLPPLVGWMERRDDMILRERHLGLIQPEEESAPPWDKLVAALHMEPQTLLQAVQKTASPPSSTPSFPQAGSGLLEGRRIAVAKDRAFCFIYPANLEWLQAEGAELCFFSPLAGEPLPNNSQGLWLPGGYPELYCPQLSTSTSWQSIHHFAQQGGTILAECGGMMALGESLTDKEGKSWPMAAVLPIHTTMGNKLAGLGYRQEHSGARGHEFHHSKRATTSLLPAFELDRGDGGVAHLGVRASYVHWYFASQPRVCARWLGGIFP